MGLPCNIRVRAGTRINTATSAPGLGLPLPICTGTRTGFATGPLPHLHQDLARRGHIYPGLGLPRRVHRSEPFLRSTCGVFFCGVGRALFCFVLFCLKDGETFDRFGDSLPTEPGSLR
jgi:hypothetical protein